MNKNLNLKNNYYEHDAAEFKKWMDLDAFN